MMVLLIKMNFPTSRRCSTGSQEEGSGEITTESGKHLRQSGKTHLAPSEAEGFGEIQ